MNVNMQKHLKTARKALKQLAVSLFILSKPATALALVPFVYNAVTLPAASGASCANGSPAKIFVNPNPLSDDVAVLFQGGGGCWDQASCLGGAAFNVTNDIKNSYMFDLTAKGVAGFDTPFSRRLNPLGHVQTQSWNIIYIPYCSGDMNYGNKVQVYNETDPQKPLVVHHKGVKNIQAISTWLRANSKNVDKMLVAGFSAGSTSAIVAYPLIRDAIQPKHGALLADAGSVFPVTSGGQPTNSTSVAFYNKTALSWGVDDPDGVIASNRYYSQANINGNDLSPIYGVLARQYPADKFVISHSQQDAIYGQYSYTFGLDSGYQSVPQDQLEAWIVSKWRLDLKNLYPLIDALPKNIGYYVPYGRQLGKSHSLTIVTFDNTGIPEKGIPSITTIVDDILDPTNRPVHRVVEEKQEFSKPTFLTSVILLTLNLLGLDSFY